MISADSTNASLDNGLLESTDCSSIIADCGAVSQSPVVDSQLTTRAVPACKVRKVQVP